MKSLKWTTLLLLLLISCSPTKQDIEYGFDACVFCKMTIVDSQHAAESISEKGRVYKFDAIECMLDHKNKNKDNIDLALFFVNTFDKPGELLPASECSFLISKNLPSPMGAFITGLSSLSEAKSQKDEKSGQIFTWQELQDHRKQQSN